MNFRQYKKKFAICRDDNGKMIYKGDIVKVWPLVNDSIEKIKDRLDQFEEFNE
jgi:hypothetical protein